ncbi:phosphate ABC transporter permease PstA [Pseudonocardiaceae bacterium YIM PH 21723]|nr:phosphate ABC transporter permease PstA [Pseudonocardiaceae bacterium YIM PH 21723]
MTTLSRTRRNTNAAQDSERAAVWGGLLGAVALTALLFTQVVPYIGIMAYVVVGYLVFLCLYALLISMDNDRQAVKDRVIATLIALVALLALLVLTVIVIYVFIRGLQALSHLNFFTDDLSLAGSLDPLTVGGIIHAVIGTLEQISIALVITIPLGIATSVFLSETRGVFTRFVRTIVEAMTALPSIVAGLFIYAVVILALGFSKSGLAAGLALSVMMLPIIVRAADVVIRLVPGNLREAGLALGAGQWRTMWHVVLPTARSGLTTAVILGTARGVGETSPVLLTAGYTAAINADPTSGPQVSLPLATFTLMQSPQPDMVARGFGAALVLMFVVLTLFLVARVLGGRPAGVLSARQQRRRALASIADLRRFQDREDS